ncbi:MAG TPA: YetF domain-containing protein [Armatimonadota bacterium]|jgi:uncharacterized membrane protein YcaP (DUF421 family)
MFSSVNWHGVFVPDMPFAEIVVRGTLTYLGILLLLRVVLKRQSGSTGVTDLLVVVMLSDAAQNGMAGDYKSVPDGLLLVATIIFWSFALDWLSFRVRWVDRIINPPPLLLVQEGRMMIRNMRREFLTKDELMGQLRLNGIEDVSEVKSARMEADGSISVIPLEGKGK